MLNESIPTASARTASSTVLRITTSPLSSRPDSSTLMGTNESKPNSMSWVLILCPFLQPEARLCQFSATDCPIGSGLSYPRRDSKELAESIDHQLPPLHLCDRLAPDDLVLSRELTRPAGGSDRDGDGDTHGLVIGEVGSSLGEGIDVVCDRCCLARGEAGHLGVGSGDVSDREDSCLPGNLEGRTDLDEPVRAASGRQCARQVVAVGHH